MTHFNHTARPLSRLALTTLALLLLALPASAQTPSPTFDAVSIKPNKSGSGSTSIHTNNDRFQATNVSLRMLLQMAYGLQSQDQIAALPGWTNSVNFDIEAKVDADTYAVLKAAPRDEANLMRQQMMQAVLADRFQLKAHHETRDLPVYNLELAKGGSRLQVAAADNPKNGSMNSSNQKLTADGIPISNLCSWLAGRLHRMVVDATGLTARYDFTLQWAPDEPGGDSPAAGADQAPSLFTALQEQLGLKLDSTKAPVDTLVVDHVETPSEN